jgi:hypothetical protein
MYDNCGTYASAVGLSQLIIDRVTGCFPNIKWGYCDAQQCLQQPVTGNRWLVFIGFGALFFFASLAIATL